MNVRDEQDKEFHRMRGEYLGLMASIEFNLTLLLAEWLMWGVTVKNSTVGLSRLRSHFAPKFACLKP